MMKRMLCMALVALAMLGGMALAGEGAPSVTVTEATQDGQVVQVVRYENCEGNLALMRFLEMFPGVWGSVMAEDMDIDADTPMIALDGSGWYPVRPLIRTGADGDTLLGVTFFVVDRDVLAQLEDLTHDTVAASAIATYVYEPAYAEVAEALGALPPVSDIEGYPAR